MVINNIYISTMSISKIKNTEASFWILYNNWIFLFPITLIIYSVLVSILGKNDIKTNIKKFHYSLSILIYFIFIRFEDVSIWCKTGLGGVTVSVWSHLFSMIVFFLFAIAVDNFIISGYVFKEFGVFGAKFIKEETQKTVVEQNDYILSLEKNLESLYESVFFIKELFKNNDINSQIRGNNFKFEKHFRGILRKYYELKGENVKIDIELFYQNDENINSIIEEYKRNYGINTKEKRDLKNCLINRNGANLYFECKKHKVYVITSNVKTYSDKTLLINIKSFDEINIYDVYPILNFLEYFELELSNK